MSATLVSPATAAWTPTAGEQATTAALVATRATTFMRAQVMWLRRGLDHASDPIALGIVLDAHDRSHDRWVEQIRAVEEALGEEAAKQVGTAYAYVGRVAASLERGTMDLLDPDIACSARQLLGDRLSDITEWAVEAVWQAAALI